MYPVPKKAYKTVTSEGPEREKLETGHERFDPNLLTGTMRAQVHLCQPLHVGSGLMEPPEILGLESETLLVKSLFRVGGQVCIPGTSLKGAFRSLVEMFSDSCAPGERSGEYAACKPGRGSSIELCPACRLFGAFGFLGNVRFDEVVFPAKSRRGLVLVPPQYNSGKGKKYGDRRYYPHSLQDERGGNWPLEVLAAGQSFELKVSFRNVSAAELGLLLVALGQGKWQLCPKLGGGKSAGLGSIHITALQGQILDVAACYAGFESQSAALVVENYIREAEDLLEMPALAQLEKDLGWKGLQEHCDEGK